MPRKVVRGNRDWERLSREREKHGKIKLLVGLTGFARAGKNTAAEHLAQKHGFTAYDMSRVLFEEFEKMGVQNPTKAQLSELARQLRRERGPEMFADVALDKVSGHNRVVICSIRKPEEWMKLKASARHAVLLSLTASGKLRFARRNASDPQELRAFLARDYKDVKDLGLGKLVRQADARIENRGDRKEFEAKLDAEVAKLPRRREQK